MSIDFALDIPQMDITDKLRKELMAFQKVSRFNILQYLDRGSWTAVFKVEDPIDNKSVSVLKFYDPKENAQNQLKIRNWTEEKFWQKEGLNGHNFSHTNLASNRIEEVQIEYIDEKGEKKNKKLKYLVEEYIKEFLSSYLIRHQGEVKQKTLLDIIEGIASSLDIFNSVTRTCYHDLKPENIGLFTSYEGGEKKMGVKLSDFGTATRSIFGDTGFIYTRSPEAFKIKSAEELDSMLLHGDFTPDVFRYGAQTAYLYEGKYPLEDKIDKADNPVEYISNLSVKEGNIIIKDFLKKSKKIPRKQKKHLRKCLDFDPKKRYNNMKAVKKDLNKIISKFEDNSRFKKNIRTITVPIMLPLVTLGFLVYKNLTYEPKDLNLPQNRVQGPLYIQSDLKPVSFDLEQSLVLPSPVSLRTDDTIYKAATNNRNVAYLLKLHAMTATKFGELKARACTDAQHQTYIGYTSADERAYIKYPGITIRAVAKSIEVAMQKSINADGKIDLEDMMTIARLGEYKWNHVRKVANSFNFKDYLTAKNSNGEHIIPKNEQKFLLQWRANFCL